MPEIIGSDALLTAEQLESVRIVQGMVIPASADGSKPSAADIDVIGRLETETEVLDGIREELDRLAATARARHGTAFAALDDVDRQALIDSLRAEDPRFMRTLAMRTAAAYYQDDRVMDALGLGARPPYPEGYEVPPGDLTLLDPVRQRGRIYREV